MSMFDPIIDDPNKEWCYAAQSTTVIGCPFMEKPVQVTYDGAVYTTYGELAFFFGKELKPLMARNKVFREGWIPVVEYEWQEEGVDYRIEMFSSEIPELGLGNLLQHIKLTMKNSSDKPLTGQFAVAARQTAFDFRRGEPDKNVEAETTFCFDEEKGAFLQDNELIYTLSEGAELYAVPDHKYSGEYKAEDYFISNRSATGLSKYSKELQPGDSFSATFKMPQKPVDIKSEKLIEAIANSVYETELSDTVDFWKKLLGKTQFIIPEKRVHNSRLAGLVHLILSTRTRNGKPMQGSGLPYDEIFLNDYMDMLMVYERSNLDEFTEPNVDWLISKQHKSGMFIDYHNRGDNKIVTSHGQGLFALAYRYIMTRDKTYAEKVYPYVKKGVEFIISDHETNNEYGILRPSIPYDAPMVNGFHTCHNTLALAAMRVSIRMARMMGKTEDAEIWSKAHDSYKKAVLKAIRTAFEESGYVTSGVYGSDAGWIQGKEEMGINEFPNQDWENNLLLYPSEILDSHDPMVKITLDTIRTRKYREGCMTYRNGMHIHQYITINQAHQYMIIGNTKQALLDLYHVLLHNGSTHEGFENLVEPWTNRTPDETCPPPHAWAAAKTALFIRNMMVLEYGGEMGMKPQERDLYLYSLISPNWVQAGQCLEIINAPTEMGTISSKLTFSEDGAQLSIETDFHTPPRFIKFRVPYFVKLTYFHADSGQVSAENGILCMPPDTTSLTIKWTQNKTKEWDYQEILQSYRSEYHSIIKDNDYSPSRRGEPFLMDDELDPVDDKLSFELIRKAFSKEYSRRYSEYIANGGVSYSVEPPSLLKTDEDRKKYYGKPPERAKVYWEDNVIVSASD